MYHEMRRKDRALSLEESIRILEENTYGVLSTVGKDGQPYGVPLSYVWKDGSLYFHCATEGQKLINISENDRVSFCVIGKTEVLPEKFSTNYESVIVFGTAKELSDEEKKAMLMELVYKYSSGFEAEGEKYIMGTGNRVKVYKIAVEHLTGKGRK